MKTNILFRVSAIFTALLLFTGCIFENPQISSDKPLDINNGGVVEVIFNMPSPQTRISLEQDGLDINLEWQTGDQLDLLLVYDGVQEKQTVTVDIINTKKASFSLILPEGDYETFDLYGVYGGGGFSDTPGQEHLVILPTSPSGSLADIQDNKAFVLMFAAKDISKAAPSVSTTFEHLGSLFHISLKNIGWTKTKAEDITKAQLYVSSGVLPVKMNGGSATYNVLTGAYDGTASSATLDFDITGADLTYSGILDFWGWYIPSAGAWPELGLKVTVDGNEIDGFNVKPERATEATAGKTYHFYTVVAGENVAFADQNYLTCVPAEPFTDSRDGTVYKTLIAGNQVLFAENLKFLPNLTGKWVTGYSGAVLAEAKAHPHYETYGVMYNWTEAKKASGSTTGGCPSGWRLPTSAEWDAFGTFLTDHGYKWDGTTGGYGDTDNKIGKAMATDYGWGSSSNTGAVGNTDYPAYRNKSGFSALPAGWVSNAGGVRDFGTTAYWWSSTTASPATWGWMVFLRHANSQLSKGSSDGTRGHAVRCIKN